MSEIQIDSVNSIADIYRLLRRLPYNVQKALYEYVDNSIQSFKNKNKKLREAGVKEFEIIITYHRKERKIEILDNAGGMDEDDIRRAFKIGTPPADPRGLSQFGVGLKGASQWFCKKWTVETKAIGETVKWMIEIDDTLMTTDQKTIVATAVPNQPKNESYTLVTLYDLVRNVNTTQLNNAMEMIGATYTRFVEKRKQYGNKPFVNIVVMDYDKQNSKSVEPWFGSSKGKKDGAVIPYVMDDTAGNKLTLEKKFEFTVDDALGIVSDDESNSVRKVKGRAVVYIPGNAKKAGLHSFRYQRIVRGGRPVPGTNEGGEKIYNIYGAPNTFQSQRLYIECDFDEWPVSVDKSEIEFWGSSRQIFEEKLIKVLKDKNDFIKLCETADRGESLNEAAPSKIDLTDATQSFVDDNFELKLQEATTTVDSSPVPKKFEDVIEMEEVIGENKPDFVINGNNISISICEIFYVDNRPETDPYCYWTFDVATKKVIIAVNNKHPYISSLGRDRSRLNEFLINVWIDAFIQNNLKLKDDPRAGFFLKIKDNYLRALTNLEFPSIE